MSDLRMPSINKISISGRITKDIELKTTPSGKSVCNFTIANDRSVKNASGGFDKETIFVECQAWGYVAESVTKSAHKGSGVIVDGRLNCRKWTNREGQEQRTWEVIAETVHLLEWPAKETKEEEY